MKISVALGRHHLNKISAKPGRVCYANDETYETGENFFPNCKTECICVDGVIGCRKAQDPAHCEGETIMAMAAHTKPIDMVEVRPANEDKNIAGKYSYKGKFGVDFG